MTGRAPVPTGEHCPNCDTPLVGAYCHACGQAADARPHRVRDLMAGAFEAFLDLDARFYRSLGLLFRRPGALSIAWSESRRVSFMRPVRLYLFASVIYFVVVSATGSRSALFANFEPGQEQLATAFQHVLLFLVPVFGLCLALFFSRSGKLYVEHLVVALHLHAAWYLILVLDILLQWIALTWIPLDSPLIWVIAALQIGLMTLVLGHSFLALRRVYGRGRISTGLRFAGSMVLYMAVMLPVVLSYITVMQLLSPP